MNKFLTQTDYINFQIQNLQNSVFISNYRIKNRVWKHFWLCCDLLLNLVNLHAHKLFFNINTTTCNEWNRSNILFGYFCCCLADYGKTSARIFLGLIMIVRFLACPLDFVRWGFLVEGLLVCTYRESKRKRKSILLPACEYSVYSGTILLPVQSSP